MGGDRVDVLGPGVTTQTSTPRARARCAAYRLPIAPQPMTATLTARSFGGHGGAGDLLAERRFDAADAEAGHQAPSSRTGSPPAMPRIGGTSSAARASGGPNRLPSSPLSQSNSAAAPATACAIATPPDGPPSIRSC